MLIRLLLIIVLIACTVYLGVIDAKTAHEWTVAALQLFQNVLDHAIEFSAAKRSGMP
jgi:hypothetical protein